MGLAVSHDLIRWERSTFVGGVYQTQTQTQIRRQVDPRFVEAASISKASILCTNASTHLRVSTGLYSKKVMYWVSKYWCSSFLFKLPVIFVETPVLYLEKVPWP